MKKTYNKKKKKKKVCRNIFLVNDNCVLRKKNLNVFFKIYCNSFSKRNYCEEFKRGEY